MFFYVYFSRLKSEARLLFKYPCFRAERLDLKGMEKALIPESNPARPLPHSDRLPAEPNQSSRATLFPSHRPHRMTPSPLILFDLGGVLVRICRTWEEACVYAGVEARDAVRFRDPALAARRKHFHNLHQTGAIACKPYFAAIAESTAGLYTADEVRRIHNAWTLDDYPGVADLIKRLRAAGVRTACLSNTNHSHWTILNQGDGPKRAPSSAVVWLDVRLASHIMGLAKPDDAIYRAAEESLGVSAGDIVFFDDLAENIAAARARGWRAHQIDHTGDTTAQIESHLALGGAGFQILC